MLLSKKVVIRIVCVLLFLFAILQYNAYSPHLAWTRLNQLPIEVERRILWWNWQDTPEEIACQAPQELSRGKTPIPKLVHFIFIAPEGNDTNLTLWDFMAVKAALLRIQPDSLRIHSYSINKENEYWKQLEHRVTPVMHNRQKLIESMGDHDPAEFSLAHQADMLRLDILREYGGIYLDSDVIALQPFDDLLTNNKDVVMGHEGGNRYGLCNAVIISRASSSFITRWRFEYETYNPKVWNFHSVRLPKRLSIEHPREICTLSPTTFFWPTWHKEHIRYMHEPITTEEAEEMHSNMSQYNGAMYKNQLAYHAWGSASRALYLSHLTAEDVVNKDTRYNLLVRDIMTAEI